MSDLLVTSLPAAAGKPSEDEGVSLHRNSPGLQTTAQTATLGATLFRQNRRHRFHLNDFSEFLLIFLFVLQLNPLVKRKELKDEQVNYIFFKQQLILITENIKQKICGTLSLERSFVSFFSLQKKKIKL